MNSAPVNGSASMEMSGTIRAAPGRLDWNAGLAKVRLEPPPAPNWKPRWIGRTLGVEPCETRFAMRVRLLPQPVWNAMGLSGLRAQPGPPKPLAESQLT